MIDDFVIQTKDAKEKDFICTLTDFILQQKYFYFELDEEKAKVHMMRLVYHMLDIVNEIRIISNARIRKDYKSKEMYIERQKEADKFLVEKVAANLG